MHTFVWWYTMIYDDILIRRFFLMYTWYLHICSWTAEELILVSTASSQFLVARFFEGTISLCILRLNEHFLISDMTRACNVWILKVLCALVWFSFLYILSRKKAPKTLIGTSFWLKVYLLVISIEDFPDGDPWDPAFPNKRSGSWAPHGNVAFPSPRHCAPWWRLPGMLRICYLAT